MPTRAGAPRQSSWKCVTPLLMAIAIALLPTADASPALAILTINCHKLSPYDTAKYMKIIDIILELRPAIFVLFEGYVFDGTPGTLSTQLSRIFNFFHTEPQSEMTGQIAGVIHDIPSAAQTEVDTNGEGTYSRSISTCRKSQAALKRTHTVLYAPHFYNSQDGDLIISKPYWETVKNVIAENKRETRLQPQTSIDKWHTQLVKDLKEARNKRAEDSKRREAALKTSTALTSGSAEKIFPNQRIHIPPIVKLQDVTLPADTAAFMPRGVTNSSWSDAEYLAAWSPHGPCGQEQEQLQQTPRPTLPAGLSYPAAPQLEPREPRRADLALYLASICPSDFAASGHKETDNSASNPKAYRPKSNLNSLPGT
ncbi:hypothetical protein I316_01848 [Kwoniella heveanensis BCC8398]|uniref:Endonuclease/exonuclease/phosphatase domain-containing protein n=1 Tax=Kwoniella heveanensis BCC8398 TaxID=1296120 RepID=A0A1B9H017_9TREE|nr:hypothetical protein I316_01848 [Kwoniella heveanensis BCC8398]